MNSMETYYGHVRTPADAIKLFEACRTGLLPRVQRRLSEKERQLIRSGSVFVWDEREAGMRRWTDGKSWSASRVSGSFLTYREMEGKRQSFASFNPPKRAGRTPDSTGRGSDEEADYNGAEGYKYKADGLIKQSFSITTSTGQHLHLISYYSRPANGMPELMQPTQDPALRNVIPAKGMYPESSLNDVHNLPALTRTPMQPVFVVSTAQSHAAGRDPAADYASRHHGPPLLAYHPQSHGSGPPPQHAYPPHQQHYAGYSWPPSPATTPPYGSAHPSQQQQPQQQQPHQYRDGHHYQGPPPPPPPPGHGGYGGHHPYDHRAPPPPPPPQTHYQLLPPPPSSPHSYAGRQQPYPALPPPPSPQHTHAASPIKQELPSPRNGHEYPPSGATHVKQEYPSLARPSEHSPTRVQRDVAPPPSSLDSRLQSVAAAAAARARSLSPPRNGASALPTLEPPAASHGRASLSAILHHSHQTPLTPAPTASEPSSAHTAAPVGGGSASSSPRTAVSAATAGLRAATQQQEQQQAPVTSASGSAPVVPALSEDRRTLKALDRQVFF